MNEPSETFMSHYSRLSQEEDWVFTQFLSSWAEQLFNTKIGCGTAGGAAHLDRMLTCDQRPKVTIV
jgi:hypothetical protein